VTSNRLVLIVDDSAPLRSAMRELIDASMLACSCAEASTGEESVELAERILPDVVVMDLRLPGMNGIEATRRIKAMLPQTPVVIVSLFEAAEFRAEAAEAGVAAFLPKRVMHRELIPILEGLLDCGHGDPSGRADPRRTSMTKK
jgi:DNA-binding NarL/FixJ family response regulator